MFKVRTTPVEEGTLPYKWGIDSVYQCVWFVYYRCLECGFSPCQYWDRATKTGSYTNANQWLNEFRDPWEVKDIDYTPVAGDIVVYDYGEYGHVLFMETDVMTSEYRNGDKDSFRNAKLGDFKGNLLGYLHYPYSPLNPVDRDENHDQIQTTDESLRIRTEPSLSGEIVGHVQLGYYDVLDTRKADGYTWYQLADKRWCADVGVIYLPSEEDFIKEFEKYVNNLKTTIKNIKDENTDLKEDMNKIREVTLKWKTS